MSSSNVKLQKQTWQYQKVNKLYIEKGMTIAKACDKVGICTRTYYTIRKKIEADQKGGSEKTHKKSKKIVKDETNKKRKKSKKIVKEETNNSNEEDLLDKVESTDENKNITDINNELSESKTESEEDIVEYANKLKSRVRNHSRKQKD